MTEKSHVPGLAAATRWAILAVTFAGSLTAGPFLFGGDARAGPLEAVVGVRASIPEDARAAETLGTARAGSGIVIGEGGLVLTIGYLILEAITTEIVLSDDRAVPADIVAYDYDTGFGLLRARAQLSIAPMELGRSADLRPPDAILIASSGGTGAVTAARVVSRRDFAGYWEYLLPDAIFTAPPHPSFGGAALIGPDGRLLGVGSLMVGDAAQPSEPLPGNMFVPIDALKPILKDLLAHGRSGAVPRPWLGVFCQDLRGRLFVNRVAPGGPAARAGLAKDDIILAVKGKPVRDMADFYRKLWALGRAGVEVPLTVLRPGGMAEITVKSADRYDYLKLKPSY
ncbi:MAG: S1C family serine protease [Kiloniellaceae bacterium]